MSLPADARCLACGYPLHDLADARCPECGRRFDPADPKSFATGRPLGRVGRWLLSPTGWWPVLLLVAAAAAALFASHALRGGGRPSTVDWPFYAPTRGLTDRLRSPADWAFAAALTATPAAAAYLLLRSLGRRATARLHRRRPPPTDPGRRAAVAVLAVAVTGVAGLIGWPVRLARRWVRDLLGRYDAGTLDRWDAVAAAPIPLSTADTAATLRAGLMQLPSPRDRLAALKLLVEAYPDQGPALLPPAIAAESDPTVLATEIRLLGMYRDPAAVPAMMAHWDSPHPDVRAAVADAVGLVRAGSPVGVLGTRDDPIHGTTTDPAIDVTDFLEQPEADDVDLYPRLIGHLPQRHGDDFWVERLLPSAVRDKLVARMLAGPLASDREAAARSLLRWPADGYRLRVAEWGVFQAHGGDVSLAVPQLDEVPPFVHRAGQTLAELLPGRVHRQSYGMHLFKPVVHLTVDRPMAVDVQTIINRGRVWYVYPRPDDVVPATIHEDAVPPPPAAPFLARFDPPATFPKLDDLREGYPWLQPHHRSTFSSTPAADPFLFDGIGVRWQSLIVSPDRLPWMDPPAVPPDARFAWWDRLRQVPSAWVASRGEADRFLYYDGPSAVPNPWQFNLAGRRLTCTPARVPYQSDAWPAFGTRSFSNDSFDSESDRRRTILYVEVTAAATVAGAAVRFDPHVETDDGIVDAPYTIDLATVEMEHGTAAVAARLLAVLTTAGLTAAEAGGLVDSWRPAFFATPGSRVLLVMTPHEYDVFCPVRVDPTPTELIRVGLIWTEFTPSPASQPA